MAHCGNAHAAVLTPCIGVCRLVEGGLCEGCHRTAEEIARWLEFSDEQRFQLMTEVLPRRAQQQA